MMIGNTYYELKAMAEELEKEGICVVYEIGEWCDEECFSVHWTISRGEDFVKASAFAHVVNEWADIIGDDIIKPVIRYSVYDINNNQTYIIKISPVWL